MADHTHIEWTDATWNPITGCTLVSDGCKHCYAATLAATRLKHHPSRAGLARMNADGDAKFTGEVRFNEQWLDQPLRWRKSRMIFVCAHGDLFHESVPDEWIDRVFAVIAMAPQHTFQVLTKRADRMRLYFEARRDGDPWAEAADYIADLRGMDSHPVVLEPRDIPLPNVWLGVSVEDQDAANKRIPDLLRTPAAIRFVSAEPLLSNVILDCIDIMTEDEYGEFPAYLDALTGRVSIGDTTDQELDSGHQMDPGLDWVIVGGESSKKARPMHPEWARSLRDQCVAAGTKFFFKQWGEWEGYGPGPIHTKLCHGLHGWGGGYYSALVGKRAAGRLLDGREWNQTPEVCNG